MKYRKKPIVIEAEQFLLGKEPYPKGVVPVWVDSSDTNWVIGLGSEPSPPGHSNMAFGIKTLEGWHIVKHKDWIITGIKGEKYPCKPDVFKITYEKV